MKEIQKKEIRDDQTEKADAALSYIPFLCFISFFKSDLTDFAKRHAKQGMILLLIEVVALFFLIDIVSKIFWSVILIACGIIALMGIAKSLSGKEMKIPIIGYIFDKYEI
ncbi:MAG: hypothetical protein ONB32_12585 [candidate division KSB1 bacterium]|nr:hypothetical protein [candidate division KSB1 bacterium]